MMRTLGTYSRTWGLEDLSPWKVPTLSFPPKLWRLGSLRGKEAAAIAGTHAKKQKVKLTYTCSFNIFNVSAGWIRAGNEVVIKKQLFNHIYIHISIYISYIYNSIIFYISTLRFSVVECVGSPFTGVSGSSSFQSSSSQTWVLIWIRWWGTRCQTWKTHATNEVEYSEWQQNQTWSYKDTPT